MAIYQTGGYRVKPSAVDKVKQAIKVFVRYLQENEPGTKMYLAWQEKNDPTRFFHLFIFEDEAAQGRHGESAAVKQFESVYSPELVDGDGKPTRAAVDEGAKSCQNGHAKQQKGLKEQERFATVGGAMLPVARRVGRAGSAS